MRQSYIIELLTYVRVLASEFELIKEKAKTDIEIQEIFKPKVYTSIVSLRTCLDYLALDLYEFLKRTNSRTRVVKRVYFPYGKDESSFKLNTEKNLPGLFDNQIEIYKLLNAIQSYNQTDSWLVNICELSNELKHNELLEQQKVQGKEVNLFNGLFIVRGQNMQISDNYLNGVVQSKPILIKNGKLVSYLTGKEKDISVTDWTGFIFKDHSVDVISLISKAIEGIDNLTTEIYDKIY
jgi:hypothetical protein